MIITDLEKLRVKSKDWSGTQEELNELVSKLDQELAECESSGAGLCAVQIGVPVRVSVMRTPTLHLTLYNAKITEGCNLRLFRGEGCLSIPNRYMNTLRMEKVTVVNGDGKEHKLTGFNAAVAQHEIDHFDGILVIDRQI